MRSAIEVAAFECGMAAERTDRKGERCGTRTASLVVGRNKQVMDESVRTPERHEADDFAGSFAGCPDLLACRLFREFRCAKQARRRIGKRRPRSVHDRATDFARVVRSRD